MLPSQSSAKILVQKLQKTGISIFEAKEVALISVQETIATLNVVRNKFNNAAIKDKITYEIQNQEWIKDAIKKMQN